MINIPKGTKDVLPQESYKWHYVEGVVKSVADVYGVKEIRTPVFEHTELFLRGVGETTDIVNKEMYTFEDKGKRSITLKPEGTAGVARSFIENGLSNGAMPLKMYYISPVFRYERPQAGRLREHHQFGIEFYGSKNPVTDAEVIMLGYDILTKLGISVKLNINSMGCAECRKKYNQALKEFLKDNLSKLCPTCQVRYEKNPLRILDCKIDECKEIVKDAPKITDYLCDDCNEHFNQVKGLLEKAGLEFKVNPFIVRGLDYYTKTVFEFVTDALGAQGTVCAGGRYDNLVSQLGGGDTPCVGFGMGLERVIMLMEHIGASFGKENDCQVYFASMGEKAFEKCFELVSTLRRKGVKCECDHMGRGVKAQFKYSDKIGAKYVITIGDNELEKGEVTVKKMEDGSCQTIALSSVVDFFVK